MKKRPAPATPPASAMAELLNDAAAAPTLPAVGDVVEGKVVSLGKNEVYLDVQGLTVGVIRGRELFDESGDSADLTVGEVAAATVLDTENEHGVMELSFRQAGHRKAWDELIAQQKAQTVVDAAITDANRGGLMVKVGRVMGFLPVSQLGTEHYPRVEGGDKNKILEALSSYIGQQFAVKIIDVNEREDKLIVSEKAALEEAQRALISEHAIGDTIDGTVTGVVDFGAFVEFGKGLEGLVHISELAWQRVEDPHELVRVGDKVKVQIIQIDGTKVSLSMKRLTSDPWKEAIAKYQVGQKVQGRVTKMNPYGAFVELDDDIHGLAHVSELTDEKGADPRNFLTVGETYDFAIISLDPKNHRLGLSRKALTAPKKEMAETTIEAVPVTDAAPTTETAPETTEPLPTAEERLQKKE